ncbi:MAG: hypothetical protein ACLFNW_05690 [Desulfobacterales bacterium]
MLDCGTLIPPGQLVFAYSLNHAVPYAIQEVFTCAGPGFPGTWRDNLIDDGGDINVFIDLIGQPEGPELFDLEVMDLIFLPPGKLGDLFRRTDVGLRNDRRFSVNAGNLTNIKVGSFFFLI